MVIKLLKKIPIYLRVLIVFIIISFSLFLVVKYKYWKSYPKDNPIEEALEDYIEHETGIEIDLSPQETAIGPRKIGKIHIP